MGHALNGSIQDTLIRLNRMRGRPRAGSWAPTMPGSPLRRRLRRSWWARARHAAISAARRSSRASGTGASATARRSSSSSSAWALRRTIENERFTMDDAYAKAVHAGVRRAALAAGTSIATTTWSTGIRASALRSQTSRSSSEELTDTLYSIDYPLADGSGSITVATVRPETMLADTAVAVAPGSTSATRPGGLGGRAAAGRAQAAE